MTSRGLLAAAAGAMVGLLIAAPVSAATTITLNPAHKNQTAAGFGTKDCTGPLAGHPTEDGWHFVLPASAADDFVSLTLSFSTPGGNVTAGPITSEDPSMPTMGAGWSGYLDNAGMAADDKHAYVFTTPGWTLLDGSAQVNPDDATGTFNLSHACPGVVSVPPSPSVPASPRGEPTPRGVPTETPPGGAPTPSPRGPVPSGGAKTGGGGAPVSWFGTTAAFFVSLGVVGYLLQRRRRG